MCRTTAALVAIVDYVAVKAGFAFTLIFLYFFLRQCTRRTSRPTIKPIIARPKIIQHLPGDQVMSPDLAKAIFKQGQSITATRSIFRIGSNFPFDRYLNHSLN